MGVSLLDLIGHGRFPHIEDKIFSHMESRDLTSLGEAHPPLKEVILTSLCQPKADISKVQYGHLLDVGRHEKPELVKDPATIEKLQESKEHFVGTEESIEGTLLSPCLIWCDTTMQGGPTQFQVQVNHNAVNIHHFTNIPIMTIPIKETVFPAKMIVRMCFGLLYIKIGKDVGFLVSPWDQKKWDVVIQDEDGILSDGPTGVFSDGHDGKYVVVTSYDKCGPSLLVVNRKTLDSKVISIPEPRMKNVKCVLFKDDFLFIRTQLHFKDKYLSLDLGQEKPEESMSEIQMDAAVIPDSVGIHDLYSFVRSSRYIDEDGQFQPKHDYYTFPKLENNREAIEEFLFPKKKEETSEKDPMSQGLSQLKIEDEIICTFYPMELEA